MPKHTLVNKAYYEFESPDCWLYSRAMICIYSTYIQFTFLQEQYWIGPSPILLSKALYKH